MNTASEKISPIGLKRMQDIIGNKAETLLSHFEKISPDFASYIRDFAYGDLYAREGITDQIREIAAVATLIGQGNTGLPLETHLKGMLNVGFKKQEVIELLIFLVGYNGFPKIVEAFLTAQKLFEKDSNY